MRVREKRGKSEGRENEGKKKEKVTLKNCYLEKTEKGSYFI